MPTHRTRRSPTERRRLAAVLGLVLGLSMFLGDAALITASADDIVDPTALESPDPTVEDPASEPGAGDAEEAPEPEPLAEEVPVTEEPADPSPTSGGSGSGGSKQSAKQEVAAVEATDLAAGDFSLDFVAAGPGTYDHATGEGGIFGNRTISKTNGVVESLEGGDFACEDLVVFFTKVAVASGKSGSGTIEIDYEFDGEPTGQPGVGFIDLFAASANPNPPDFGNTADGDETVTVESEAFVLGPPGRDRVQTTIRITGLESGESFILRLVVRLGCQPGATPTGNIQSSVAGARFMTTPTPKAINVGQQTIPLKKVEDVAQPGLNVVKTCTATAGIGDEVTYEITVSNDGNEALENLVVNDPLLGGDLGTFPSTLAVGESVTRSFTHTVTALDPDPLTNTVTATGTGVDSQQSVSDTDACEADVLINPAIDLDKTGPALAHRGDAVTYAFTVENVGDTPLFDVTLTDPNCDTAPTITDDGDGDATLAVGEVWTYTCDHVVADQDDDPLPNTAVVSGIDREQTQVSDEDSHAVDLIHPAIRIVKSADPVSGAPGDEVTYTYIVENTGDTTLFDVSVDDDKLGHIGDIPELAPGASETLTATATLGDSPGDVVNVGTAAGADVLGETVTDDDDAIVSVVLAAGDDELEPPEEVAFTGADARRWGALAIALAASGWALLILARRRESGAIA